MNINEIARQCTTIAENINIIHNAQPTMHANEFAEISSRLSNVTKNITKVEIAEKYEIPYHEDMIAKEIAKNFSDISRIFATIASNAVGFIF